MEQTIDPETLRMLNTPLQKPDGFDAQDKAFLEQIVSKVDSGKINLFTPSSIINTSLYESLAGEKKAIVDMEAFTTLAAIREIHRLYKAYKSPTYQLSNLLNKVRLTKEKFESAEGDVFVI